MVRVGARAVLFSFVSAALVAGAAIAPVVLFSGPVQASGTGSISGTVTGNGSPLPNICVQVDNGFGGPGQFSTATAGDGTYTLSNLPTGQSYVIRFDNNGNCQEPNPNPGSWQTQWYNDKSSFQTADPVNVPDSTPVTGVDAALAPGGSISGKVVNVQTGAALNNICVNANPANNGGGPGGGGPSAFGSTGPDGTYQIGNLSSGAYVVDFNDCQGRAGSWIEQVWESASNFNNSTAVAVSAPNTTPNIDAALSPGGTIQGTVTNANGGAALARICVVVDTGQNNQFGGGPQQISTSTNNTGAYSLKGLPIGKSYVIRFDNNRDCPVQNGNPGNWVTQWYNNQSSFAAANPVNVPSATPVTGINAQMVQGGAIAGTVSGSGTPQQGICVSIDAGKPGGVVFTTVQTDNNGNYVLPNLAAGMYKVRFEDYSCSFSPGPWITQWANGKPTFGSADQIAVTAGQTTQNVNATLASGAGSISGSVTAAAGDQQQPGICVYALTSSGGKVAATMSSGFFGQNNDDYSISGLAPNANYRVRFDGCGGAAGRWVTQFYDDVSSLGAASAVAVTSSHDTPNIDAAMVAIAITNLGPSGGSTAGGTSVTIAGSGLAGATAVKFGSTPATTFTVLSDGLVTATAPAHAAGAVKVTVVTPSGTSNGVSFTYS